MTKVTWSRATNGTTDAGFRTWGSEISTNLAACGLVQTANTGQINWTTATYPGTDRTPSGYEVFRFNDSLQSTAPIYIRINYGRGNSSLAITGVQVGTATDGAVSITANVVAVTDPIGSNAAGAGIGASATPGTSYATHGNGFFTLVGGYRAYGSYTGVVLGIDRSRDSFGAPTNEGVYMLWGSYGSAPGVHVRSYTFKNGAPGFNGSMAPLSLYPELSSTASGGTVYLGRHYMAVPQLKPSLIALSYNKNDLTPITPFSATVLGSSHTYLPITDASIGTIGNAAHSAGQGSAANSASTYGPNAGIALLWED